MHSLFEKQATQNILTRLNTLNPSSTAQWGKMNVSQMMAHCSAALEVATGQKFPPRLLLGKILSPFFKQNFFNHQPFAKNSPTDKSFIITDNRDFNHEKNKLTALIQQFADGGAEKCTTHPHSFFGKLSPEQWSIGMYKHLDHHLQQFGS